MLVKNLALGKDPSFFSEKSSEWAILLNSVEVLLFGSWDILPCKSSLVSRISRLFIVSIFVSDVSKKFKDLRRSCFFKSGTETLLLKIICSSGLYFCFAASRVTKLLLRKSGIPFTFVGYIVWFVFRSCKVDIWSSGAFSHRHKSLPANRALCDRLLLVLKVECFLFS